MTEFETVKEFGAFALAAVATWLSLRKSSDDRIDERIKAVVNPDSLTTTLDRIDNNVTTLDKKLDALSLDVARMQGREEARQALPAQLADSAKLHP